MLNMRMIFLLILSLSLTICQCSFTNLQSIDASHHTSKISICSLDQWLCEFIDLYIYNEQRDISDRYMRKLIRLKMEKNMWTTRMMKTEKTDAVSRDSCLFKYNSRISSPCYDDRRGEHRGRSPGSASCHLKLTDSLS